MTKPKLLVLASTFPRDPGDGTPGFVLDLATEQAKEFDVTVLTPRVPGSRAGQLIGEVKVVRYRYWPFAQKLTDGSILDNLKQNQGLWLEVPFLFLGLWLALARQLTNWKPDVIHAHWIIPQGLVSAFTKGKTPLVITAHGGDIYALNAGSLKNLKIWALNKAAAITTVNGEMKQQLASWGLEAKNIQVLPMGADFSKFQTGHVDKIPSSVLAVGRLVEKKGFDALIDAVRFGLENKTLPASLKVRIAGDGPLRADLERQAQGLPIEFLGNQSQAEIAKLLSTSQIFVIPSRIASSGDREGLPVTLMEAAAASSFVVASRLPGIEDLVVDGETGLLIEPGSFKDLSVALSKALSEPELRDRCGQHLNAAAQRFDVGTVGASYNSLIRSLT